MRRVIAVGAVSILILTAFLLDPRPSIGCHGGCRGGGGDIQQTPQYLDSIGAAGAAYHPNAQDSTPSAGEGTPSPQQICKVGTPIAPDTTTKLEAYELNAGPEGGPLCTIDVVLGTSKSFADSTIVSQEAATIYVRSGEILFDINPTGGPGTGAENGTVHVFTRNSEESDDTTVNLGEQNPDDGSFFAGKDVKIVLKAGSWITIDPEDTTNNQIEVVYTNTLDSPAELVIASAPTLPGPDPTATPES